MNMIFNEILRLYPPVVALLSLHRDKDFWGDDALEFKPERFENGISKASNIPGVYCPFSGGPRICIGMNYTMVEAKVVMAAILQRFSFELSPSYKHSPKWILTVQVGSNANVILRKL